MDTCILNAMEQVELGIESSSTDLEKIVITSNDIIVISFSLHQTRPSNIAHLIELLNCIDYVKAKNITTINYLQIVYLRSSPQHYWTQNG